VAVDLVLVIVGVIAAASVTCRSVATDVYSFDAEVWEHHGSAAWFFVSLPEDVSDEIEERYGARAGGFGSVRVEVTVGTTSWRTSLFPDSKRATYVLPVKRAVRVAEGLTAGSVARVRIGVLAG
jgi:hypothetical protein